MFNSVHYRNIFSYFSFDDTYMFVPIQFGINVDTKNCCNIHPVYVHSINTNHINFFISFVTKCHKMCYLGGREGGRDDCYTYSNGATIFK